MSKTAYEVDKQYRPISAWGYVGYTILYSIPVIGWILFLVFTFHSGNLNRRSFTRSIWCWALLWIIIIAGGGLVLHTVLHIDTDALLTSIQQGNIEEVVRVLKRDNKNTHSINNPADTSVPNEMPSSEEVIPEKQVHDDSASVEAGNNSDSDNTESVTIGGRTVLVHREFKQFMDSYEALMMDYIESMKSGDLLKMANATGKYTDALEKLDEIDEDSLSDADMAYYLEVVNRVNQQLLLVNQ